MTREQAIAEAERCTAAADVDGFWAAREGDDGWEVVQVTVPGVERRRPTGTHTESRSRPESPGDPRSGPMRDVPPYGAA